MHRVEMLSNLYCVCFAIADSMGMAFQYVSDIKTHLKPPDDSMGQNFEEIHFGISSNVYNRKKLAKKSVKIDLIESSITAIKLISTKNCPICLKFK